MAINTVKVTVNGTTVNATSNGDGTYTAKLVAPSITSYNVNAGHYYPVKVTAANMAGTATVVDDTHATLGSSLKLRVKETTAPTISIISPTNGQYLGFASPTIKFDVTDESNGSGIAISTLRITVDSTKYTNTSSEVKISAITGGYSVSCTPTALSDGEHSLQLQISDNDGNAATSTIKFVTDTIAPTLSVSNPVTNGTYVANSALTVTGTTSDSTSGTPTVKITLNGDDQGSVTVSNGSFSKAITLVNGSNTIVVTATDKAGRVTTITRTITLDTSSPVIASVVINPNPVDVGANYTVTIKVTG